MDHFSQSGVKNVKIVLNLETSPFCPALVLSRWRTQLAEDEEAKEMRK